jgi:SAM-dependent methyltransferase
MRIVEHYESCLQKHGDTHLGVDWPNAADADTRHAVMLGVMEGNAISAGEEIRLLDFGCGASHLNEYMLRNGVDNVRYSGLDLSERFVALSRSKFPDNDYWCLDLLDDEAAAQLPRFDYVVLNGVLTEKVGLSFDEMLDFAQQVLRRVFSLADAGIAFNTMSKHVDWERDDLFHVPFDLMAAFLTSELTRDFVFRNDYGLYEYTTYAYKPRREADGGISNGSGG